MAAAAAAASSSPPADDNDNVPNEDKVAFPDYVLKDLMGHVRAACETVNDTMSLLRSDDLDGKDGLNEAGFKLAFLVALGEIPEVLVQSERDAGDLMRADVTLIDYARLIALVVELKYVRCGFLQLAHHRNHDGFPVRHFKLNTTATHVADMQWRCAKKELFLSPELFPPPRRRRMVTVQTVADKAREQAAGYARRFSDGEHQIMCGGKGVRVVGSCTVIGVASACFFDPECT